jgi:hypothetical protein
MFQVTIEHQYKVCFSEKSYTLYKVCFSEKSYALGLHNMFFFPSQSVNLPYVYTERFVVIFLGSILHYSLPQLHLSLKLDQRSWLNS